MKKRMIACMLAVLLLSICLCGCGKKDNGGETEQPATVGTALLADFKAQAEDAESVTALAQALANNGTLPFNGVVAEVEPGLLAGFGNAEITGFQAGASFAPMVGTIPFIGYVFELEDGTAPEKLIQMLEDNADLRWNICAEAEEMVTGSAGDKVFFVMCPKQFEA